MSSQAAGTQAPDTLQNLGTLLAKQLPEPCPSTSPEVCPQGDGVLLSIKVRGNQSAHPCGYREAATKSQKIQDLNPLH